MNNPDPHDVPARAPGFDETVPVPEPTAICRYCHKEGIPFEDMRSYSWQEWPIADADRDGRAGAYFGVCENCASQE